ncbi:MAG: GFA family protein [Myxococcota bacterium]
MPVETLTGRCLCGQVRYTAVGEPVRFYHCHCSRCRHATGTGHASNLFLSGTLTFDSGEDLLRRFSPPDAVRFTNTFCSECGGRVPRVGSPGMVFIPAGSLDVEPSLAPQARIFFGSKASWACSGGVPEHDMLP